jgi:hypothetical protein
VNPTTGSTSLSFDVNSGLYLPMALIAYAEKAVNVSYSATGQLTESATGAVPSATAKSGSSIMSPWLPAIYVIMATMFLQ